MLGYDQLLERVREDIRRLRSYEVPPGPRWKLRVYSYDPDALAFLATNLTERERELIGEMVLLEGPVNVIPESGQQVLVAGKMAKRETVESEPLRPSSGRRIELMEDVKTRAVSAGKL